MAASKGQKVGAGVRRLFVMMGIWALTAGAAAAEDAQSGNFNRGWQFHRFDAAPSAVEAAAVPPGGWARVDLPHTARIEPRIVNDQWQGDAIYRKLVRGKPAWHGKRVWLKFDGAMNKAEVWMNGRHLATHLGGYLPFTVDLTGALTLGADNDLIVKLDNRDNPVTGPKPLDQLDFNTYGGLYRDVTLIVKNPVHISDPIMAGKPAGGGIFVRYPEVSRQRATLSVETDMVNQGARAAQVRVTQRLIDSDGRVVGGTSGTMRLAPDASRVSALKLTVANPKLWSPRAPNLYRLVTEVRQGKAVVDRAVTRIGIRRIEIGRDGFRINGEQMFLRGVNRHQEYPYIGYALSHAADHRDARRIKEAGFDYVRLSHYPQSPAFMDAADELGLVLLDSIPGWQYFNPDPAFRAHAFQTCRDMIRRDRNHPSVIGWECSLNETAMPKDFVQQMHAIVHQEYPGDQAYSAGWQNDGYDIYLQARQHRIEHYQAPDRPYIVSEYGDWEYYALNAGFNQKAWADLLPEARTSRQLLGAGEARLLQQATNIQEAHNDNFNTPAFADGYWAMFDYNRGYADDLEASGVMSLERLPKYSYYFFRSQRDAGEASASFDGGPMAHIASRWDRDSSPDVRVYSNADEVELFLNGRSLGRRKPDTDRNATHLRHPPFTFATGEFSTGTLEAIATIGGRIVARHRVTTPGAAKALALSFDMVGVPAQPCTGDAIFAHARVVDGNGTVVPVSGMPVRFTAIGDIEIVGPQSVPTEAGIASVLVRVGCDLDGSRLVAHAAEMPDSVAVLAH